MSRPGRIGKLKIDHKIITHEIWCMLKGPDTQVRRKDIGEHLEAYMGERPSEELLDAAVAFKKIRTILPNIVWNLMSVSFSHQILRNILDQNDVDRLSTLFE